MSRPPSKIAVRQAKEIELLNAGKHQGEIAKELGISRTTFWRDVCRLTKDYTLGNREAFGQLRDLQVGALMDMAREVHDGTLTPKAGNSIRGFLDSVSKLLGLNAPTKHQNLNVTAKVDSHTLGMYERFFVESEGLTDAQFEQVWGFMKSLPREEGPSHEPPDDCPAWHPAPKQLTGGSDGTA